MNNSSTTIWGVMQAEPAFSFVESIGISVVAAVLAYSIWAWVRSPHLIVRNVSSTTVVDPDEDEDQTSLRVEIQNIGTVAAENCEGFVEIRARKPASEESDLAILRGVSPTPWLTRRADLIVTDDEHFYNTLIPAGRSKKLELYRQYPSGNLKPNAIEGGARFVEISSDTDWHGPVDEEIDFAFKKNNKARMAPGVKSSAWLDEDEIDQIDWDDAVVRLTVETESAPPLIVDFEVEVNDGDVVMHRKPEGTWRSWKTLVFKTIIRIRR